MESKVLYLLAADELLFTHVLFVAFVIFGLLLIFSGKLMSWSWVCNPWFRMVHLIGIGVVVLQSWLGIICPLTTWEMAFRSKAGDAVYAGTFISHWLETILYYHAPDWVFIACYTAFVLLFVVSWIWVSPSPLTILENLGAP